MKVCELSTTVDVEKLKPGDTFEYAGLAYLMTEMCFSVKDGIFDDEEKKDSESLRVAVCLSSGHAIYMYHDEEVTNLDLKVVFDR